MVDFSYSLLKQSLSPFNTYAWATLFHPYKAPLTSQFILILRFGARLSYQGSDIYIILYNLSSTLFDSDVIKQKLDKSLLLDCIIHATQIRPFISLPLGLIPKPNKGLWRIYHLLFPQKLSLNSYIPMEATNFKYTILKNILTCIRRAGQRAIITKKDINDVFQNIPVAFYQ